VEERCLLTSFFFFLGGSCVSEYQSTSALLQLKGPCQRCTIRNCIGMAWCGLGAFGAREYSALVLQACILGI